MPPTDPIRVLVVDDSAIARRLIVDALSNDPEIEVVGTAHNGRAALDRIAQLSPDVVTLDVEMPELDGLQTVALLRKTHSKLAVVMCSALTERGAITTLDALGAGANDYITKPSRSESVAAAVEHVRGQLVRKVKALGRRATALPALESPPRVEVAAPPRPSASTLFSGGLIAIGASTGGPAALAELLPKLAREVTLPIVITQHMPPVFTTQFAARLAKLSGIPVREAAHGDRVAPGTAWVAPGDHHLTVENDGPELRIAIHQGPPENFCRPAVDVMFRSVAAACGRRVIAVVLTGMGQDGCLGARDIRAAGGQVLAQDEASSVVWGMPGAVVRAQLADRVLPLDQLDAEIAHRARTLVPLGRGATPPSPAREDPRGH